MNRANLGTISASEAEKYLLHPLSPEMHSRHGHGKHRAWKLYLEGSKDGVPTGIGWHEQLGWFVLKTDLGPYFVWTEKPNELR